MIGHRDSVTCSFPPMLFEPAVYYPGNHCDEQRHANDDAHDEPCERAAVLVLVVPATTVLTRKLVILVDAERFLGERLCNAENVIYIFIYSVLVNNFRVSFCTRFIMTSKLILHIFSHSLWLYGNYVENKKCSWFSIWSPLDSNPDTYVQINIILLKISRTLICRF